MSVGLQVGLVADQQLDHILVAVLVDFSQPVLDVLEGLPVGDVIDEDDPVGSLVVGGSDGLEPLLASSVPDLELHGTATGLERPDLEVDSDGGEETRL